MTEPFASTDSGDETGAPRWVKVFGVTTLVVVLLFVILLVTKGRGGHGPRRHISSTGAGSDASRFRVVTRRHDPGALSLAMSGQE